MKRALARNGGSVNPFAATVLAVGIATLGSVIDVLDRTVLRPIPYPEPERLVQLRHSGVVPIFSRREVADLRELPAFEALDAYSRNVFTLVRPGGPVEVEAGRATGSLFRTLGVGAAAGRVITESDSRRGAAPVAVVTHSFWREAYGQDPSVVGRSVELVDADGDGELRRYPIVGVLPAGVGHPFEGTSVWLPVTMDPGAVDFGARNAGLHPVARLARGVSVEVAQAMVTPRVKTWVDRLSAEAFGGSDQRRAEYRARADATVIPLVDFVSADTRPLAWSLLAFGLFVLAIGAANVSSLHISRSLRRRRDLGVRYQLGASRWRLARSVLKDSAGVSGLGACGGLLLMALTSGFIRSHTPVAIGYETRDIGGAGWMAVLGSFAVVTVGLSLAGGVLGVEGRALTALRAGRTLPRGSFLAQRLLIAVSACVTVALGLGAGLMFRTVQELAAEDPGFQVEGLVTVAVSPALGDPVASRDLWAVLVGALGSRGDVGLAGAGYNLPLTGHNSVTDFHFVDHSSIPREDRQLAGFQIATPGYVEALGLRLLEGRSFGEADDTDAPRVALVNAAFATEYFPGASALGAQLTTTGDDAIEVVGVVSDTRHSGLDSEPDARLYYPAAQFAPRPLTLVVRTAASPSEIGAAVRGRLAELDPYAVVTGAEPYESILERSMSDRTRLMDVLGLFAVFGVLVSALGLFGTMHGWINERRREVGIRSALGAAPAGIARWVAWAGTLPVVLGGLAGLAVGLSVGHILSPRLYGVEAWDPVVLGCVVLIQGVVAALSVAHPAAIAASTEPALEVGRAE